MAAFALHLLRHGRPEGAGRLLGRSDAAATRAGIAACAARAAGVTVAALVSSDLARARDCAAAIGTPDTDQRWRELDFGAWDGRPAAAVDAAALAAFWDDPDAAPPPGGERWSALVARVAAAIDALPPRPTLVVTHAGAMRAALTHLCGLSYRAGWAIDLPYAALLSFMVEDGTPRTARVTGLAT